MFALADPPHVPVTGTIERFPVGRIFCIGRNYAAHAREMGGNPERETPFFFAKWASDLVPNGAAIPYPPETGDLHYEAELVVALGRGGARIPVERALDLVYGYAVGLDMTRRDLQNAARDKGRPWDVGKNFACSAPLAAIGRVEEVGHVTHGATRLAVNGQLRQEADVADMIWTCAEQIAYISRFERLVPGDLIYTGTPAGVGPVIPGDIIDVTIDTLAPLRVTIAETETDFR